MDHTPETLYLTGDSFFAALSTAIRSAQKSLDIQCYIFAADQLGRAVVEDLEHAAARGVVVRVVVDGFGSALALGYLAKTFKRSGIELHIFHPLRLWAVMAAVLPRFGQSPFLKIFRRMNRRNHRKIFVVDQREAFIGSLNICEDHLESIRGSEAMRDVGLRLSDARVADLQTDFNLIWRRTRETPLYRKRIEHHRVALCCGDTLFLNTTLRQRWQVRARILRQIQGAAQAIFIANAYVVPDGKMLRALVRAARRGVDVRIMVSKHSDVAFMAYVTGGYYRYLLQAGVRVFHFQPSVLHMKIMMIDDWALVGSSNLNHRSLLHDLEVDAVITDRGRRLELQHLFSDNLKLCREVSWEELQQRPWWVRLISALGFYLRFWL